MQEWTADTLWAKAGHYARQAMDCDPKNAMFPLLASLSLELLGKAALSKIHPALIADPRGEGEAILYAFGVATKDPKTIMANTVFRRLPKLIPGFTEEDQNFCLTFSERRNRELHTGENGFADYGSGKWLPDFYRICKLLTEFLGRNLPDLLGKEHAAEAEEITADASAKVKKDVLDRIQSCKKSIASLRGEELEERRKIDEPKMIWVTFTNGTAATRRECPACGSVGQMHLRHVADRPAEIIDDTIYVDGVWAPRKFTCKVCGLEIEGTTELRFADMADQIVETNASDPVEYFDIEVYSQDEPDYGNE